MRRLEKLDAKVQHLQAQQEVAHCLPFEEVEEDTNSFPLFAASGIRAANPTSQLKPSHHHAGKRKAEVQPGLISTSKSEESAQTSMNSSRLDICLIAETALDE